MPVISARFVDSKTSALAALAVVSAASAQSTITITGLVDMGPSRINYKGTSVTNAADKNGSATTALIFAGSEDLGGGTKAIFQYEIDPTMSETQGKTAGTSATGTTSNVTSSVGNGQSFVGLTGNYGSAKFGTPNLATLDINGLGNSGFGTAIGSGYRVSSFDAVRLQNSAKLESAVFSGFSASMNVVAKNTAQSGGTATGNAVNQVNGRDSAVEIGLKYANGPIAISYANLAMKQDAGVVSTTLGVIARNSNGEFKLNSLAASYQITPEASAALFYQTVSSSGLLLSGKAAALSAAGVATAPTAATALGLDRKTVGVSGSYLVTPTIKIMANYALTKTGSGEFGSSTTAAAITVANAKTKVLGLGADYSLSKRTALYIRYERDQDGANLRSLTGYTAVSGITSAYTATAVGIRHTF